MSCNIDEARERILHKVNSRLKEVTKRVDSLEKMQRSSAKRGVQIYASVRLRLLLPGAIWWSRIKTAIESDRADQALPALKRLIRHFKPQLFHMTWIAPISPVYWEFGLGPMVTRQLAEDVEAAGCLIKHYIQRGS